MIKANRIVYVITVTSIKSVNTKAYLMTISLFIIELYVVIVTPIKSVNTEAYLMTMPLFVVRMICSSRCAGAQSTWGLVFPSKR